MLLFGSNFKNKIYSNPFWHTVLKFRLSEKDTKFEKIFHLEFDTKSNVKF